MTSPAVGDQGTAAWADARPPAASGSVVINTVTANTVAGAAITFPSGRFSAPPIVTATAVNATSTSIVCGIGGGTTTSGVSIYVVSAGTGNHTINWTAVQPL